jgi:hypothetical protein
MTGVSGASGKIPAKWLSRVTGTGKRLPIVYLGFGFVEAVEYLASTYGCSVAVQPFKPKKIPYSTGLHHVSSEVVYPRGKERPKRIIVLVDENWLSAGAIAIAGGYPEARVQWRNNAKLRDITEFCFDRITITVFPVLEKEGSNYRFKAELASNLFEAVRKKSLLEQGSIHIADEGWWSDTTIPGGWLARVAERLAEDCPVYFYQAEPPKIVSPPPANDRSWGEVLYYLTRKRGIDEGIVTACRTENYLYGTNGWLKEGKFRGIGCGAVFVTRTMAGVPCGAVIRSTRENAFLPKRTIDGMDRNSGFFWRRVGGENSTIPPTMYVTEAPIEALSVESLAGRLKFELSNFIFIGKSGEGGDRPVQVQMGKVLADGGQVFVGFNSDKKCAGLLMMKKLTGPFGNEVEKGRIQLLMPESRKDWNDVLCNWEQVRS